MIEVGNINFYDILETAKMLKVSPETVRRYIHSGKLKSVKMGKYLISETEINNVMGIQN